MDPDRRTLVKAAGGAPAAMLGLTDAAAAPAPAAPSLAPLQAAGLDPFTVYRQMFLSTASPATGCWWYLGMLPIAVPDVGSVPANQVVTLMALRGETAGKTFTMAWREVGVFRDIASGAPATPWLNPMTDTRDLRIAHFEDGPGHYTVTATGTTALNIKLEQARADIRGVAVGAEIVGDRVCLTQAEDKARAVGGGAPSPIRTTLKIYASLAALKAGGASVPARGFYSVRNQATGTTFVSGLMEKTADDTRLNPEAWDRMVAAYPAFFAGGRVAPAW